MELTQVGTTHRLSEITYHLKQIDGSGELQLSDGIRKIRIPSDNCDEKGVLLYNLDAIIAVGYRVNSYEASYKNLKSPEELKVNFLLRSF